MDLKPPNLSINSTDNTPAAPLDQSTLPVPGHSNGTTNNSASGGSFQTLEPYNPSPSYGRGRGRGGRGGRTNRRNYQMNFPPLTQQEQINNYKRFYVIKPKNPEINIWKEANTIKANRQLEQILRGPPKRINELLNGTLLIEIANYTQSQKIVQINKLDNIDVETTEHNSLNFTKGTIRSERFSQLDDDVLLEELAKYGVTELYKMKKKSGDSLVNTGTIILTFDRCELPATIKIGWTSLDVRQYIPNPRQCYKCQKYNHSSRTCRSEVSICNRCGESDHIGSQCSNPLNCANCGESHKASDRQCFFYSLEKEIVATQTLQKIGYKEAKKTVLQRQAEPNATYSDVLKSKISRRTIPQSNANNLPSNRPPPPSPTENNLLNTKRRHPSDSEEETSPTKKTPSTTTGEGEDPIRSGTTPPTSLPSAPLPPSALTTEDEERGPPKAASLSPMETESAPSSEFRAEDRNQPPRNQQTNTKTHIPMPTKSIPSLGHQRDRSRSSSRSRFHK